MTASDPMERSRIRRGGWVPPGPRPAGALGRAELVPGAEEDLAFLTGDFRIFQLKVGHRWSLDDFVTAYVALEANPSARRAADLGCGIGSVLMMLAWGLPEALLAGVEAQDLSARMAERSIAYNGIEDRCALVRGDLRETHDALPPGSFDLVTGTPPYIPIGSGLVSNKEQRRPCFFETLGGIEDYARAAARLLAPGGRFVACYGVWPELRGEDAARAAGLEVISRLDVIPREGKPVLFRVVTAGRAAEIGDNEPAVLRFVVRDRNGDITSDMLRARERMGQPP
ncbi:MAG: methyltransferase [Polyangiaceae bacterium]|nr:methyltransferase [Polyangiaceae bacterium]